MPDAGAPGPILNRLTDCQTGWQPVLDETCGIIMVGEGACFYERRLFIKIIRG